MNLRLSLALCAGLLALGSCTSPDSNEICGDTIFSRADPSTDFSAIQTFAVLSSDDYPEDLPADLPSDTQTSLAAANNTVRAELLDLGLQEVDPASEDPDVWVFSLAASDTETGTSWQCVPGYIWWGLWGWVWDPCAWLEEIPVAYEIGTVIVGIADADTQKAVFGGAIQGVLACENPRDRLTLGVEKIFESYPL